MIHHVVRGAAMCTRGANPVTESPAVNAAVSRKNAVATSSSILRRTVEKIITHTGLKCQLRLGAREKPSVTGFRSEFPVSTLLLRGTAKPPILCADRGNIPEVPHYSQSVHSDIPGIAKDLVSFHGVQGFVSRNHPNCRRRRQ